MTRYTVKDPLGKEHIIEGPDHASEAEVLAQAALLFPDANANVQVTPGEAAAAGMVNAATLGFAPQLMNESAQDVRNALIASRTQQPASFAGGSVLGSIPAAIGAAPLAAPAASAMGISALSSPILAAAAGNAAVGAGLGLEQGLGNSINAPNATASSVVGNTALNTGLGGLLGGATSLAGAGASAILGKLTQWASGMPSEVSQTLYEMAQNAKPGTSFSEQLDNYENELYQMREGGAINPAQYVKAKEYLDKASRIFVDQSSNFPPNALTADTLSYAIKNVLGGLGGLALGHPVAGAMAAGLVSNPALSATTQQILGTLTSPVSGLAAQLAVPTAQALSPKTGSFFDLFAPKQ
jgi:hypothetical protein